MPLLLYPLSHTTSRPTSGPQVFSKPIQELDLVDGVPAIVRQMVEFLDGRVSDFEGIFREWRC